jgi:PTS system mannose-specific IIC component
MAPADYLMATFVAVGAGLDRTAIGQFMVSRPIVVAPLTGWLLGDPAAGLQIGALVELLWLGRLPIGAAIPPDDTQVAVGATVLALSQGPALGFGGPPFVILATLVAMPLGKLGQFFDRLARHWNGTLVRRAQESLAAGDLEGAERSHLRGAWHFAAASLATFLGIVGLGSVALSLLAPFVMGPLAGAAGWLRLLFPLIGTAVILGSLNVNRTMALFGASFCTVFLLLLLS